MPFVETIEPRPDFFVDPYLIGSNDRQEVRNRMIGWQQIACRLWKCSNQASSVSRMLAGRRRIRNDILTKPFGSDSVSALCGTASFHQEFLKPRNEREASKGPITTNDEPQ